MEAARARRRAADSMRDAEQYRRARARAQAFSFECRPPFSFECSFVSASSSKLVWHAFGMQSLLQTVPSHFVAEFASVPPSPAG